MTIFSSRKYDLEMTFDRLMIGEIRIIEKNRKKKIILL